jgi:hypothetical protein
MPLAFLMIGGMILGIGGQAVMDSGVNVDNTCKQIDDASSNLENVQGQYQSLLESAAEIKAGIDEYRNALGSQKSSYEAMTKAAKEFSKIERNAKIVGLCIFLFFIVIALIFKYLNIFGLIWRLITGKKSGK